MQRFTKAVLRWCILGLITAIISLMLILFFTEPGSLLATFAVPGSLLVGALVYYIGHTMELLSYFGKEDIVLEWLLIAAITITVLIVLVVILDNIYSFGDALPLLIMIAVLVGIAVFILGVFYEVHSGMH